ncbi:MAG: glutaredoxin family protein [Pedobacter sp.]|nr:glutaredoxin family protein [Pedobacter sp.]
MSAGRVVLLLVVLSGFYAWQHQYELKRWWRVQSGSVPATSAGISVYTAQGCGPCEDAIHLLQGTGRPVLVRNIDEDAVARDEFESAGGGSMPLIVDGRREMRGFNPELLQAWYVDRPHTASRLDQVGVYRGGEARIPILYGTTWCPYCAQARQYFDSKSIRFRDLDIEHDAEAKRQYDALGLSGIPVMVYEDMIWNGFSAQGMDEKRKWVGDGHW